MKNQLSRLALLAIAILAVLPGCASKDPITRTNAANANGGQIAREAREALASLYAQNPGARALGASAKAVLVFPSITRVGFVVGGQGGNGVMFWNDQRISGFYQIASASYGLQAGAQRFSSALFLMDDEAIRKLNRSGGWEIGGSPSVVVGDRGMAGATTTTTIDRGTYVFFFNHRGLMAGLGIHGSKITPIQPQR